MAQHLHPVLRDVSLKIPAGQVVGIVGPSGSGKSTIAKLLQRLYLPESGRIMIDETDTSAIDPGVAAPPDRRGAAGEHPVQPFGARQHRPYRSDDPARAGDGGSAPCRRP